MSGGQKMVMEIPRILILPFLRVFSPQGENHLKKWVRSFLPKREKVNLHETFVKILVVIL
jgi:hypothetical protein